MSVEVGVGSCSQNHFLLRSNVWSGLKGTVMLTRCPPRCLTPSLGFARTHARTHTHTCKCTQAPPTHTHAHTARPWLEPRVMYSYRCSTSQRTQSCGAVCVSNACVPVDMSADVCVGLIVCVRWQVCLHDSDFRQCFRVLFSCIFF